MNPLCCIAPVSIDRDRCQIGADPAVKAINSVTKSSFVPHLPSVVAELDRSVAESGNDAAVTEAARDSKVFGGNGGLSGSIAGVLYKWVNYGKGWRARWFELEDGVLSYYKVHGPDKILMSPAREKSIRVIGEESVKYMRKASWSNNGRRQCKPFGEVHLKVSTRSFRYVFRLLNCFVRLALL